MKSIEFVSHFRHSFPNLVGGRVLVALSGGADSVALLHLLREPALRLVLEAAHVHHQSRGVEADRDATFCAELCGGLAIPFHLLRIDVGTAPTEGREGAWRAYRYRALLELARRLSVEAVATAHHRDDVSEGVIMQLLRGAGTRAMAGIAAATDSGVIRPLLPWRRRDIVDWLRSHEVVWIEDSSNSDLGHLRNLVRHVALPELRGLAPRIDDHAVALAEALADDEAFFASELERLALWIEPWDPDGAIALEALRTLPRPLRSRWLHAQAARAGIGRVTRAQIGLLHRLLDDARPRALTLAGRWRLRLAGGRLWLEPPHPLEPYERPLEEGCGVSLPIPGWRVRVARSTQPSPRARWHWLAPDSCRLSVRSPRSGDRVEVGGTAVGVTRLMAPAIPRHLRRAWPLFCENARIAWVPSVWERSSSGVLLVEVLTDG